MFTKFKSAIYSAVGTLDQTTINASSFMTDSSLNRLKQNDGPPLKFKYTRPSFLQLNTDDEIQVSADHVIRPIIVPRDITKLPYNSGYAEYVYISFNVKSNIIFSGQLMLVKVSEMKIKQLFIVVYSKQSYHLIT